MSLRTFPLLATTLSLALLAAACGDASEPPTNASSSSGGTASGGLGSGGGGTDETHPTSSGSASCATATADGALAPGNLIFMVDQSDSMFGKNTATRWTPATNALNAFFGDAKSAGFNASIQFFPQGDPSSAPFCASSTYATPKVGLKSLPNSTEFAAAISGATSTLGTPTATALQGALDYAQTEHTAHPEQKTVVVLVTDGLPNYCGDTKDTALPHVISVAKTAAAAGIPVYVIGVGPAVTNLNDIAQAGGTTAIFASDGDPAKTAADVQAALDTIRGQTVSCDFTLPAPPAGQTLDINAVNVVVTTDGQANTLTYEKDCATGAGWHYDDATAPTKVELCANACDAAKAQNAKITVAFGCATKGGVR